MWKERRKGLVNKMAKGSKYVVQYRRKRKGKTDYNKRLETLKSGSHRMVIRPSDKHIIVQIIEYKEAGDIVKASAHSTELKKFGWTFSTSNTPAAYLTGLLCGFRGCSNGIKDAILDIGLNPSIKGSRLYAALRGAVDSGFKIPHDASIFPDEGRIKGEHIATYRNRKDIPEKFVEVKGKIMEGFKNKK